MEEDGETSGSKEKDKTSNKVCPVCNKAFSSSKAVGGHMRIHAQAKKHLSIVRKKRVDAANFVNKKPHHKKLICLICGKNFPSMKSLCGHMRCHPGRNWKGIHPPKMAINTISFSVTAKRCRKAGPGGASELANLEDDRLRDAVFDLMTLACGDSVQNTGLVARQRFDDDSEGTDTNSLTDQMEKRKCNAKIGHVKNKKRRRKVRLSDLEIEKYATPPVTSVHQNLLEISASNPSHGKYMCVMHEKSIKAHQEFECDRSGNNKHKTTLIHSPVDPQNSFGSSEDEKDLNPTAQADEETAHKCCKILDFDLNEPPSFDNEAGLEF